MVRFARGSDLVACSLRDFVHLNTIGSSPRNTIGPAPLARVGP